ncbi:MAG: c-type cytochrome domain-containing protein, partial [Planctomycetaceae bacterium]
MNTYSRTLAVTTAAIGISVAVSPLARAADKPTPPPDPQEMKFFETEIRPLLFQHCYRCHGPKKQESGLRLDSWAGIIRGGESGPALVPGQPADSLIGVAVSYDNEELQMPPDAKLDAKQISSLTRWIERGAAHPDKSGTPQPQTPSRKWEEGRRHWAFQRPVAQSPPVVRDRDWPRTPLDHFVLAALEKQGLRPAPPADRRTLIRRATLDLTGLPP